MDALFQKYFLDPLLQSDSAINRKGEIFELGEDVIMAEGMERYAGTKGQTLIIEAIYLSETCESGYMIHAVHKATRKKFNCLLDINWFQKLKTT
jgi:tryptophanase